MRSSFLVLPHHPISSRLVDKGKMFSKYHHRNWSPRFALNLKTLLNYPKLMCLYYPPPPFPLSESSKHFLLSFYYKKIVLKIEQFLVRFSFDRHWHALLKFFYQHLFLVDLLLFHVYFVLHADHLLPPSISIPPSSLSPSLICYSSLYPMICCPDYRNQLHSVCFNRLLCIQKLNMFRQSWNQWARFLAAGITSVFLKERNFLVDLATTVFWLIWSQIQVTHIHTHTHGSIGPNSLLIV